MEVGENPGFVPDVSAAERISSWANAFATEQDQLEYLCLGSETFRALRDTPWVDADNVKISTTMAARPVDEILERCRNERIDLLISGVFSFDTWTGRKQSSRELVRSSPCMTIAPIHGRQLPHEVSKLMLVITRGPHDLAALKTVTRLREVLELPVSIVTVEEESGSRAEHAGRKAIHTLLHDMDLEAEDFEIQSVVDRNRARGISRCMSDHDIIVFGTDASADVWQLRKQFQDISMVNVKRSPPLRLRSLVEWMPRINPRDHADLLQDLRHGSRWNSDFVFMLTLASAIATLGLMQNSPAVVIGSMLLAPLMTPMIGLGLGARPSE